MALVEIKENKLNLCDREDELLAQTEVLVEYVISDLEEMHELLDNGIAYGTTQRVDKYLITLSMVLGKIDDIKIVSHKQHLLN